MSIFFTEILHAGRKTIDMKQQMGFSFKTWIQPPGWTWGAETEAKIQLFLEHGHATYQVKGDDAYFIANNLPADNPPPQGGGVKTFFSESSHVAY